MTLPDNGIYAGSPGEGDITLKDGKTVVGHVSFPSGSNTGTLTFNDGLVGLSSREGQFSIIAKGTETSGTGQMNPENEVISKSGWIQNGDYDENGQPKKITWNISINNENSNEYGQTTVIDHLDSGQSYVDNSFSLLTAGVAAPTVSVKRDAKNGDEITFTFSDVTQKIAFIFYAIPTNLSPDQESGNFNNTVTLISTSPHYPVTGSDGNSSTTKPVKINYDFPWGKPNGTADGNQNNTDSSSSSDSSSGSTPSTGSSDTPSSSSSKPVTSSSKTTSSSSSTLSSSSTSSSSSSTSSKKTHSSTPLNYGGLGGNGKNGGSSTPTSTTIHTKHLTTSGEPVQAKATSFQRNRDRLPQTNDQMLAGAVLLGLLLFGGLLSYLAWRRQRS